MQKLTDAELSSPHHSHVEAVPALQNAKHYFAMLNHNGKNILCILDNGKWRVTTYNEMMSLAM